MNLGLGLALELQNGKFGSIYDGLIKSGATMILDPNRPSGKPFTKLSPRTLPNGVKNGEYLQNVSNDLTITSAMVVGVGVQANVVHAQINIASLIGIIDSGVNDLSCKKINSSYGEPLNNANADSVSSIGKYLILSSFFRFILPLGTTLEQARTLLAGTVIRYQLATPIDTLNSPFVNPLVDLTKRGNNALLQNFIPSSADGYDTIIAPNGKTVTVLNLDGSNSFGALASSDDLNPTNGDFALGCIFEPRVTNVFQYVYSLGNPSIPNTPYFGIQILDTGQLRVYCGASLGSSQFLSANTFYKTLLKRKNGLLKLFVNGVEKLSVANTFDVPSDAIIRLCSRINDSSGVSHSNYFNGEVLHISYNNGQDVDKYEVEFNKLALKQFGL